MPSFKINFALVCSLLLAFTLKAEEPVTEKGQMPPFEITAGDTSSLMRSELDSIMHQLTSDKTQVVEDTALPPCDIVFYKSGKLEYCKIIETTPTSITYKMCDYQDGPNIVVNKSDIHKIRYANGREEIITADKPTANAYVKPRKDPLATLSLIFGLSCAGTIILFGLLFPIVALAGITLGIISLLKIHRRKGELRGKGAAIVGIILCAAALLLLLAI